MNLHGRHLVSSVPGFSIKESCCTLVKTFQYDHIFSVLILWETLVVFFSYLNQILSVQHWVYHCYFHAYEGFVCSRWLKGFKKL